MKLSENDKLISDYKDYLLKEVKNSKIKSEHVDKFILFAALYLKEYLPTKKIKVFETGKNEVSEFLRRWIPQKIHNFSPVVRRNVISGIRKFYHFLHENQLIDEFQLSEAINVIRKLSQP